MIMRRLDFSAWLLSGVVVCGGQGLWPTARTCTHQLRLPAYKAKADLEAALVRPHNPTALLDRPSNRQR